MTSTDLLLIYIKYTFLVGMSTKTQNTLRITIKSTDFKYEHVYIVILKPQWYIKKCDHDYFTVNECKISLYVWLVLGHKLIKYIFQYAKGLIQYKNHELWPIDSIYS